MKLELRSLGTNLTLVGLGLALGIISTHLIPYQPRPDSTLSPRSGEILTVLSGLQTQMEQNQKSIVALTERKSVVHDTKVNIRPADNSNASDQNQFLIDLTFALRTELQAFFTTLQSGDLDLLKAQLNGELDNQENDNVVEFNAARQIMEVAISTGKWTTDDANGLREWLPKLSSNQIEEVIGLLGSAIDNGEIELHTDGGPPIIF